MYYFDAPANDNDGTDAFSRLCERFQAACRPGSGVSREERHQLHRQLIDMTRKTAEAVTAATHDIDVILRRSQLIRDNI